MSKSSYILIKIDFHIVIISITSQRTEKTYKLLLIIQDIDASWFRADLPIALPDRAVYW